MNELIALLIFICIFIVTIYLVIKKHINWKLTIILLGFSILSAFVIANYDFIKKFKWGDIEVETYKKEIVEAKESAIKEIEDEVKGQKESIKLLISNANDVRNEIEKQKEVLEQLIKTANYLQNNIEGQKKIIMELNQSTQKTKKNIEKLNNASQQIALILVRSTYLTINTKNEFGTDRVKKAIQEIENDLNKILPMVIADEGKRSEWIKKLQNILPSKE